jgi:hypothetical protein
MACASFLSPAIHPNVFLLKRLGTDALTKGPQPLAEMTLSCMSCGLLSKQCAIGVCLDYMNSPALFEELADCGLDQPGTIPNDSFQNLNQKKH